jgi:hypothetical protein
MNPSIGLRAALLIVAILVAPEHALTDMTRAPELVPAGQPIPKGFKTWSLFLVCNPAWLGDDAASKTRMATLHSAFLGFGRSLGSQNAAVWFTTSAGTPADYDADRASDFCETYRLESNRSPYIVVSGDYPTTVGAPGDFISVSLVGLDADNVLKLLGQLSDLIRVAQLDRAKMDADRYWRGWAQVLEDGAAAAGKIAKGFSFTVDTRVIKIKFDPKELSQ